MRRMLPIALAFLCPAADADPWKLSAPVTLAGDSGKPHFHHLDGSNRRHVAASRERVAVIWEDDRTGEPQVYISIKPRLALEFAASFQLSDGAEAYEPSILALADDTWLAAWEQDGRIVACLIDAKGRGPLSTLVAEGGRQVSLAVDAGGRVAAAWSRKKGETQAIEVASLKTRGRQIAVEKAATAVTSAGEHSYQGYPAAVWGASGELVLAWEDRRAGHTRLFYARRRIDGAYSDAAQLNEHNAPPPDQAAARGMGTGVMRVSLAANDGVAIRAVWLDKRNPSSGYAVWGALSADAGKSFSANEIVQDEMGAAVPQWHASIAAGARIFVAAWDDTREAWGDASESGDVLLSWSRGKGWSPDLLVPGASGTGYQGSPAITLDPHGDLHLVWIERNDLSSASRLRYLLGRVNKP